MPHSDLAIPELVDDLCDMLTVALLIGDTLGRATTDECSRDRLDQVRQSICGAGDLARLIGLKVIQAS